ncbi:MAG: T9SS type A sorting domain-containing protein [Bacteroidia bacterium]|nr:T9SS type A sorting domain-containing protein [Bacteroidia bacterium]MDW8158546.1 T9SS type A sorting domain-containing protein [Bacteroidia bacterium]
MQNIFFLVLALFLLPLVGKSQSIIKYWKQEIEVNSAPSKEAEFVNLPASLEPTFPIGWVAKNSSGLDTINYHFIRCANRAVYFVQKNRTYDGFWAGTLNRPIPLASGDSAYITQHGVSLRLEVGRDRVANVKGVLVLLAPGTNTQGVADTLGSIVWAKLEPSPGQITLRPISGGTFTLDDFNEVWDDLRQPVLKFIEFRAGQNPVRTSDVVVTVVTKDRNDDRTLTDDYINLVFTQPNTVCDPNNENDWYIIAQTADWQRGFYADYNRFLGLRGDSAYDVPAIMPVVDYVSGISDKAFASQGNTKLYGSYPNPALDQTTIKFELVKASPVTIRIINLAGKVLHQESFSYLAAGIHEYTYDTRNLPCGTYIYSIQSGASGIASKFWVEK